MAEIRNLLAAMEDEERTLLDERERIAQLGRSEQQSDHPIRKSGGFCIGGLDRVRDAPFHHASAGRIPAIRDLRRRRGFDPEIRPRGR